MLLDTGGFWDCLSLLYSVYTVYSLDPKLKLTDLGPCN